MEGIPKNIRDLLEAVNDAYNESDEDRAMMERAFDISSRELIEANSQLRDALSHLEALIENAPFTAIQGFDHTGLIIHWNSASDRLYGYKASEAIGKRIQDLILTEETAGEFEKTLKIVWETQKPMAPMEWQVKNRRGESHWVYSTMFPLFVKDRVSEIICMDVDITEKKKLETQLIEGQKMKAMGTLAGGIAHDFNNLLMGIMGYVSLMSLDIETTHPHYDKLKNIEDLIKSGALLTRQLLGVAQEGRYELKTIDLNKLIKNSAGMFSRTKKEITIHQNTANGLWAIEADQGQIEQVFMNLFVNACQAMPGGGDIYLETKNVFLDEKYVEPYVVPSGKYVKVSITDTGIGMDESTKNRIFEPFFTTKGMGRGTGLGLSIVYGIVRGHKGIVNVYSERGRGTTFNIYLPASLKEIPMEKKISKKLFYGTETILIVDDEVVIVNVTKEMLENLGYRILTANSGSEALKIFKSRGNDIDLVILDMIMPGLSGNETFDQLKDIRQDIKVILSSGYSLNGHAAEIMAKGCKAFIQKPFLVTDLSRLVRDVLDQN
jgi:PAS domain S-box-containing protein